MMNADGWWVSSDSGSGSSVVVAKWWYEGCFFCGWDSIYKTLFGESRTQEDKQTNKQTNDQTSKREDPVLNQNQNEGENESDKQTTTYNYYVLLEAFL